MRNFLPIFLLLVMVSVGFVTRADCPEPYPPSLIKGFTRDCARTPQMTRFCGCVINTIQKTISLSDFIETGSRPDGLNKDPRVIKATAQCSAQFPVSADPAQ